MISGDSFLLVSVTRPPREGRTIRQAARSKNARYGPRRESTFRSSRVTYPPARYLNIHESVQGLFDHGDDPTTYDEAISDIDSSRWLKAMKFEMDFMSKNQVWDLVNPPKGIVPIENKWVFKRKIGADGKVETYKARLVLSKTFSMKDLGEATYILRIRIHRDKPKRLIDLSQAL
ncbi:hypothetical protein CRG98_018978 [Punica granatum]|uniref:Reverse transcriptase Ty1/copia-type domain-containing protein n=1 Tax=Punica granatum TaxID=22663 RepID=A0A2I0JWC7_PUNGR|nr:hypothetical protein CRG98_018978 [Punica granatum]